MTPRQHAAHAIRDAALVKIRQEGRFEDVKNLGPVLGWRALSGGNCGLEMSYRTPFQKVPGPSAKTIRLDALNGLTMPRDINLPYGLDIWIGRKVFNFEWCADGRFEIVNFKRGEWENTVLSWVNDSSPGPVDPFTSVPSTVYSSSIRADQ